MATDHEGKVVYWNRAAEAMQGSSAAEVAGMDIRDVLATPESRGLLEEALVRVGRGEKFNGEIVVPTRDGAARSALLTLSSVPDHAGVGRGFVGHFVDISERKRLEAQLLQSQKMEAVGRLAGGVAHDFNNLLHVIVGYADFLARDLGPDHRGMARVTEIQKAATRAANLTRQLLAFSRQQVLQPQILNLNSVVEDMEAMLRRLIGEHIEFISALAPSLGSVRVDPGQVQQVIMNLVVNARDAMPRGGKLIFETANALLDESFCRGRSSLRPGPYVVLAVSDTGEGMDAETLSRIFEPFFTTKEQGKGTGLGLSTVYGILKQSGGDVTAYSEPGRGTTFKVFLPRVEEQSVEGQSEPAPGTVVGRPVRGTETILVIEDEDALRLLIVEILEEAGYSLIEASRPSAALAVLAGGGAAIDLLLTDVVLPGMSGTEVAREVRGLSANVRVLFMSGYTDEAIGHHGVLEPGTPFLQKPFSADALLMKVREVLAGRG
jgi:PAS domain S-box-containing protein